MPTLTISLEREREQFQAGIGFTSLAGSESHSLLERLHPEERLIYDGFSHYRRKRSYLLGRLSAKAAVAELTGEKDLSMIQIASGVFQFPVVKCKNVHNIQVSISHCENKGIGVAFPEAHPMGVDIERVQEHEIDAILSQFTPKETKLIGRRSKEHYAMDNYAMHLALFTAKEALSKVIRTGMTIDFKFLETDRLRLEDNVLEATFSRFPQYKSLSRIIGDYAVSIVLPGRTKVDLERLWRLLSAYYIKAKTDSG